MTLEELNNFLDVQPQDEALDELVESIKRTGLSEDTAKELLKKSGESKALCLLKALALLRIKKVDDAIILLEKLISEELTAAMLQRADLYASGIGRFNNDPNYSEAYSLLDMAIEKGSLSAKVYRAQLLLMGQGTEDGLPKFDEAISVLTDANESGNSRARALLAFAYIEGIGVFIDVEKGIGLLDEGIKKGEPDSMVCRAAYCMKGEGERDKKPNYSKAIDLLTSAMQTGNNEAVVLRAVMLAKGYGEPSGKEDPNAAIRLLEKTIEHDCPEAKILCAMIYLNNQEKAKDPANLNAAIDLLKDACEQGSGDAMVLLAREIRKRSNGGTYPQQALSLYDRAIKLGNKEAIKGRTQVSHPPLAEAQHYALLLKRIALGDHTAMSEISRYLYRKNESRSPENVQKLITHSLRLMINHPKKVQQEMSAQWLPYSQHFWNALKKLNLSNPALYFAVLKAIDDSKDCVRSEQHPLYTLFSYQTTAEQESKAFTSFFTTPTNILSTISEYVTLLERHHDAINNATTL